eukprot:4349866-Pyramimonas_sp.AAC.1
MLQDPVTVVACIPQNPFVIIGCESGAVRVISLRASAQSSTSLKLTDYELDPDEVFGTDGGHGTPVISLLVLYAWGDPVATRVLIGPSLAHCADCTFDWLAGAVSKVIVLGEHNI